MISVREVHKSFGRVRAVRGVSLEIRPGEAAGLLGPNGAGKSTTIRMITGFLPPDRGRISVGGHDVVADSAAARAQIGYLPESAPAYPEMRVGDFLRFRGRLYGLGGRELRAGVERAIGRCWLGDVRRRRIGHLSKGYRQRVGLAAALVHDPRVLILDEPANGLDPTQILEVRELIRELAETRTVLVSSHILAEVERTCDRVVIIAAGQVRADGPPDSLLAPLRTRSPYVMEAKCEHPDSYAQIEGVVRSLSGVAAVSRVNGVGDAGWVHLRVDPAEGAPDLREPLSRALLERRVVVRELRREVPGLETVFIRCIEEQEPER